MEQAVLARPVWGALLPLPRTSFLHARSGGSGPARRPDGLRAGGRCRQDGGCAVRCGQCKIYCCGARPHLVCWCRVSFCVEMCSHNTRYFADRPRGGSHSPHSAQTQITVCPQTSVDSPAGVPLPSPTPTPPPRRAANTTLAIPRCRRLAYMCHVLGMSSRAREKGRGCGQRVPGPGRVATADWRCVGGGAGQPGKAQTEPGARSALQVL